MSKARCEDGRMKKQAVILEPALEVQVVTLNASQRRKLGHVYLRWARQLFVSARILEQVREQPVPQKVPVLPPRKAALN